MNSVMPVVLLAQENAMSYISEETISAVQYDEKEEKVPKSQDQKVAEKQT